MAFLRAIFVPLDSLPVGIRNFLIRRAAEMTGLALVILAGCWLLAMATWSPQDPSLNHASGLEPENLLGFAGAVVADLSLQFLGFAGLAVPVIPAIWGWRLMSHRGLSRIGLRLGLYGLGLIFTAGFASTFPGHEAWVFPHNMGGLIGDLTQQRIAEVVTIVYEPDAALVIRAGLGLAAVLLLFLASAMRLAEVVYFSIYGAGRLIDMVWTFVGALAHLSIRVRASWREVAGLWRGRHQGGDDIGWRDLARPLWRLLSASFRDRVPAGVADPNSAPGQPSRWWFRRGGKSIDLDDPLADRIAPRFDSNANELPGPGDGELALCGEFEGGVPQRKKSARRRKPDSNQNDLFTDWKEDYQLPPLRLLTKPKGPGRSPRITQDILEDTARVLEGVLRDFGIRGQIINVRPGPVVTLYELEPAPGIKSSRVIGLADDIARSMSAISARVAVVPGRNVIGIELPNAQRQMVFLRELLASEDYEKSTARLPLSLGKDISGAPVIIDLSRLPHLLIAGTTGSGKSVGINTMILSLLYRLSPEQCKLIMIDPKMLELSVYEGIPHLLTPVVTDPKKAIVALKWTVREMESRYHNMSKLGVRNISNFNARINQARAAGEKLTRTVQTGFDRASGEAIYETQEISLEAMPYIVVVVDEMADLMMVAGKDIEGAIQRLAQMARAAGIHIIMATQRPSVDVITGTIKANFPTRISFQVTSKIDSRTILGEQGAEQLLGQGDMLYMAGGGRISRVHGGFVSDGEVEDVVRYLKKQGTPDYLEAVIEDQQEDLGGPDLFGAGTGSDEGAQLYDQAVAIVARDQKASTSYLQRRLGIGYNRAANLIERMEEEGIISLANSSGKREILIGEHV